MLEHEIIAGLRKGNEKVLDELFNLYYVKLTRYALGQINDTMVAEEIVQDVYIYLWNRRNSVDIQTSLEAYLYRSVTNKCINYIKGRIHKISKLTSDEEVGQKVMVQMVDLEIKELQQLIGLALKSLPERTALIYSFSRNAGLTHAEIAEKLDVSQKTIEYHISSALRLMKDVLEKYGYVFLISFFFSSLIGV